MKIQKKNGFICKDTDGEVFDIFEGNSESIALKMMSDIYDMPAIEIEQTFTLERINIFKRMKAK